MLNIKYDSNYKNVVNKIIEELNEKLKTYLIFDGDITTALNKSDDTLNIDHFKEIVERDNPINYRKPFHLFIYKDMLEIIKTQNKENTPKYEITVNNPESYLYIQLTIEKETMIEYARFNNYENTFSMNMFNNNGLYIEKMNDINNRYLLVGIKRNRLEENVDPEKLNLSKLNIEYKSEYKNIANKIIDNISKKISKYNIYNKVKLEKNILGNLQIVEDNPFESDSEKVFDLFTYEHMVERLNYANTNFTAFEDKERYLYVLLCIKQDIIKDFDNLNELEKQKIKNLLKSRGIYFKEIKKDYHVIIGINIDLID